MFSKFLFPVVEYNRYTIFVKVYQDFPVLTLLENAIYLWRKDHSLVKK